MLHCTSPVADDDLAESTYVPNIATKILPESIFCETGSVRG